jgi:hypothetical protein
MYERTVSVLTLNQFPQTFLTNPSKPSMHYRCKIPTVITETLIVYIYQPVIYIVINKFSILNGSE